MSLRFSKSFVKPLFLLLLAGTCWTYFQPAFRLQFSGVVSSQWSAQQLAKSFYREALKTIAPKKQPVMKVKIDLGFVDFLKRLFPQKKHEPNLKATVGLVFGILIPINFLLAYLSILAGMMASLLPRFRNCEVFFSTSFLLSSYALAGIWVLQEKADDLVQVSLEQASGGIFGFISKSFVPQIGIEPGIALQVLPVLAAAFWLVSVFRRK